MDHKFLAVNKDYFGLGLKSLDLLILSQIEEFQRNNRDCYLTNEQLSDQFGESTATIMRSLAKLEHLNIITRNTIFIEGNGRGNRKRILSLNNRQKWNKSA